MISRRIALLATIATIIAVPVQAHDYTLGDLKIGHPWTRATARAGGTAAGFLTIRNTGNTPDRLIAASSPIARVAELHTLIRDEGVMRMRPVPAIDLPPGEEVKLAPGGLHIMLIETSEVLRQGATAKLTLRFERAGTIEVDLAVEAPGAGGGQHGGH